MDYKSKYFKYKKKYLSLKNSIVDFKGGDNKSIYKNIYEDHKKYIHSTANYEFINLINLLKDNLNEKLKELKKTQKYEKINKSYEGDFITNVVKYYKKKQKIIILKKLEKKDEIEYKDRWFDCKNNKMSNKSCGNLLKPLFQIEQKSTAFILYVFCKSLLYGEDENENKRKYKLSIKINDYKELNGEWLNDQKYIKIGIWDVTKNEVVTFNKKKLIMGFGPSGAGKSFYAQKIINYLSKKEGFPKCYLSIDGGIGRNSSINYQMVVDAFKQCLGYECPYGFKNLFGELFHCCKNNIKEYLNNTPTNNFSLYVPETLASMNPRKSTVKYYKKIISDEEDQIGLFIWQHKNEVNCPLEKGYTCSGVEGKGEQRSKIEGKKYSSSNYNTSINKGKEALKNFKYKIEIHNSGGKKNNNKVNKSIIVEYSKENQLLGNDFKDQSSIKFYKPYEFNRIGDDNFLDELIEEEKINEKIKLCKTKFPTINPTCTRKRKSTICTKRIKQCIETCTENPDSSDCNDKFISKKRTVSR
jgi:hypothetical protein